MVSSSYEKLREKLPSKQVIDVVEKSSNGQGVIAADVAATAGVSLSQARKDLTALASLSQGDIAVSNDGELIYTFPDDINAVLASRSSKYQAQELFRKAWPRLFWVIRVSFGLTLVASLVAIFSAILFIQTSSSSSDDDRDDRGGFGGRRGGGGGGGFGGFGYFWGPSPLDFFYYRPYGSYGYYSQSATNRADPDDMGFFESVFSYIFGDGNPNQGMEEKRLQLAADMIRSNNGAVTAEQLAPFCDDAPAPPVETSTGWESSSSYVDENFVLPIVTQLSGEPVVTENGNIVYTFPDLQLSTSSTSSNDGLQTRIDKKEEVSQIVLKKAGLRSDATAAEIKQLLNYNRIDTRGAFDRDDLIEILWDKMPPLRDEEIPDDPTMLVEREYKFSVASDFNRVLAAGLGVVNLGGALYLGNLLGQYAAYGVQLPGYFGIIQAGFPLLLAYAVLYNLIPLGRSFWVKAQNEQIQKRNKLKSDWKAALANALLTGKIGEKIEEAKKKSIQMKQLGGKDDIVFDTRETIEDLGKKKSQEELDEFDKAFQ